MSSKRDREALPMLPLWVEFFKDLVHVRGRTHNTVAAYRRDLDLYAHFLATEQPTPRFYLFMKSRGLSVRSQARVISSVRTYLRFLKSKGYSAEALQDLRSLYVSIPPLIC